MALLGRAGVTCIIDELWVANWVCVCVCIWVYVCVCVVSVCCLAGRQAILFICFQSVCLFASWFANVYTVQTTKGERERESCPHPSLLLISLRVESSLNLWAQLHTVRKRDSQSAKQAGRQASRHPQPVAAVVNRQIVSIFAGCDVEPRRDLISSHRALTHRQRDI